MKNLIIIRSVGFSFALTQIIIPSQGKQKLKDYVFALVNLFAIDYDLNFRNRINLILMTTPLANVWNSLFDPCRLKVSSKFIYIYIYIYIYIKYRNVELCFNSESIYWKLSRNVISENLSELKENNLLLFHSAKSELTANWIAWQTIGFYSKIILALLLLSLLFRIVIIIIIVSRHQHGYPWTSLTAPSLSPIASGKSSGLHPVSAQSCSM